MVDLKKKDHRQSSRWKKETCSMLDAVTGEGEALLLSEQHLLLGRNVVAGPFGDEGRNVRRQHGSDEVVLHRKQAARVHAVEQPLRLDVVARQILLRGHPNKTIIIASLSQQFDGPMGYPL